MAKLGFLILGQTPRPDIEKTYRQYLPEIEFVFSGGLDGLTKQEIHSLAAQPKKYPLLALLNDGSSVEIDMYTLLPNLEKRAETLKNAGVEVVVLMCAGQFPDLNIDLPVIYPQRVVQAMASGISANKTIWIISPNQGQLPVALHNWQEAGFTVAGKSASPLDPQGLSYAITELEHHSKPSDCLILDCMGFSPKSVELAKKSTSIPVLCPQRLVAKVVAEFLNL